MNVLTPVGCSLLLIAAAFLLNSDEAFGLPPVTHMGTIDVLPNIPINAEQEFGYVIEPIGDIDGNGVIDLAVGNYGRDLFPEMKGSVTILLMSADGAVDSSNEILLFRDSNAAPGLDSLADCHPEDWDEYDDRKGPDSMAFMGNMAIGSPFESPTLAVSFAGEFGGRDGNIDTTGMIYFLQLFDDGYLDYCYNLYSPEFDYVSQRGINTETTSDDKDRVMGHVMFSTDLNGDGQLELIFTMRGDRGTNPICPNTACEHEDWHDLHILFFNPDGSVDNSKTVVLYPDQYGIFQANKNQIENFADRGTWQRHDYHWEYLESGTSIDGLGKIAVASAGEECENTSQLFVLDLDSDGQLLQSTFYNQTTMESFGLTFSSSCGADTIPNQNERLGKGLTAIGDVDNDGNNDLLLGSLAGKSPYLLRLNADNSIKSLDELTQIIPQGDSFAYGLSVWETKEEYSTIAIGSHEYPSESNKKGAVFFYSLDHFYEYFVQVEDSINISYTISRSPLNFKTFLQDSIGMIDSVINDLIHGPAESRPKDLPIKTPSSGSSNSKSVSSKQVRNWVSSQSSFASGINHLIITGAIDADKIQTTAPPKWVISELGYMWEKKQISNDEYYHAIEYLIKQGILR